MPEAASVQLLYQMPIFQMPIFQMPLSQKLLPCSGRSRRRPLTSSGARQRIARTA